MEPRSSISSQCFHNQQTPNGIVSQNISADHLRQPLTKACGTSQVVHHRNDTRARARQAPTCLHRTFLLHFDLEKNLHDIHRTHLAGLTEGPPCEIQFGSASSLSTEAPYAYIISFPGIASRRLEIKDALGCIRPSPSMTEG